VDLVIFRDLSVHFFIYAFCSCLLMSLLKE